ncbi:MAG: amidase [Chloroflexi bacterium]|nr:amidase [Chloroflexota bacterium]
MSRPSTLTISQASRLIASGELSPVELVQDCLDVIEKLEPRLRAWETIDRPGALEAARVAGKEISDGGVRGPLHGIPVGLKDIYFTAGMRTSMSSRVYANFIPEYDAAAVESLKASGAIILGKTVTTEFASGDPSPTINPWNKNRTPGGSSSGSSVAVAVGMCPVATGSQTAGSVNRPAAYNGVVGLKPTYGRVSRWGVFPVSWTLDTLGWMTREVRDAAIMLDALSGYDPRDPGSANRPPTAATLSLDYEDPMWTPRIGIVAGPFADKADLETKANLHEVSEALVAAGAIVDFIDLPDSVLGINEAQAVIDYSECAQVHREMHDKRAIDFAPNVRSRIEVGQLIPASAYVQAQQLRHRFRREMEDAIGGAFDALLAPATPSVAPAPETTGSPAFQAPWTTAGLPALNIPTKLNPAGLPLGVQFIARGFEDERLLRVGRWAERTLAVDLGTPEVAPR